MESNNAIRRQPPGVLQIVDGALITDSEVTNRGNRRIILARRSTLPRGGKADLYEPGRSRNEDNRKSRLSLQLLLSPVRLSLSGVQKAR